MSTAADGGGAQNFTGSVYEDSVCVHGLKATQQPLGVLDATSAQYPGQGIIGFVPSPNITQQPYGYFDTLCGQGQLEACTFGLALKPDNSGTLAVGYAPGTTGLGAGTLVTVGGGSSEADAGYMEPADGQSRALQNGEVLQSDISLLQVGSYRTPPRSSRRPSTDGR